MSDLVILAIALAGFLAVLNISLFFWHKSDQAKSTIELKMFQMENTRIVQQLAKTTEQMEKNAAQRHADSVQYLEGMWGSLGRVIRKQEEGEGEAK